jgi:hypothetical protein
MSVESRSNKKPKQGVIWNFGMLNKSEFVILRGPDIIDTGIPIVIATENYRESDVAIVESYTLIPRRKIPLFKSRLIYQGASLINMYSANHLYKETIDTAETQLKWHFIQTLGQNQKIVSPEYRSFKLEKLKNDNDTKQYLLKNYNEQLEVIKKETQCTALSDFLKDLIENSDFT